ncbi:MAG: hypothetical protein A2287_03800 [Candidatus Melainabacteria bacterium RIFOXYA12_FULL_32_12]|nr:MAG: hypothetical protein A2104_05185 [Candidatus Melainabacteria bacterium GWF2_32_7]OGI19676.1 MAG: hypothetical protein A2255_04735 [Candidatus Melainabacteria bacterium RIFOXYA2_FULL_32_9]OGI25708.1 MAG: hypothetical protein A2287_03800 [Candidatus Melainabacteria bacterium RIFOXYA12_FULL_32_12]
MKNLKNIKFVNGLKSLGVKVKWFLFTELQDFKLTSDYINYICPDAKKKPENQIEELRNLVKQSLVREFSPKIQDMKSFDLIVDGVMHKIQKKSLEKELKN